MLNRKFISRNYKHLNNGGGIAKSDIDITLENLGYQNIGLKEPSITITSFMAFAI